MFIDSITISVVSACTTHNITTYVIGCLICVGAIGGYVPQLISLVKAKSGKGLHELSVFLLCLSLATLTLNSLILNWFKWSCFKECDNGVVCFLNILNVFQVGMSWIMATIVYVLFIRFRCTCSSGVDEVEIIEYYESNEGETEEDFVSRINLETFEQTQFIPQWILDWSLFGIYVGFVLIVIIISILEKSVYEHHASNQFFLVFAYVLGIISSAASFVVWIPQIWHLITTHNTEGLSLIMFLVQAPGSLIVVLFQAIVYQQPTITWMPYAINSVEQFIVAGLLIWLYIKNRREHSYQKLNGG